MLPTRSAKREEEPKPVQGILPDSIQEYRVAVALGKLDIKFIFQWVPGIYTRGQRGSTTVDFLVLVAPLPVMLFVDGLFYHKGIKVDQENLLRNRTAQLLAGRVRQEWVAITDDKLEDQASADSQIRFHFGGR